MRILNSKYFYICLIIIGLLYSFVFTKVIKYTSNISNGDFIEGVVISESIKEDKITYIIKVNNEKVIGNFYLKEDSNIEKLLGKTVKFQVQEKTINNNTIPNTFNYQKYLYNQKIYKSYAIKSYEILENENIFYKIKNALIKRIDNYHGKSKTYISLFILGDKTYLNEEDYEIYRSNGIWHLFAISGMHINLLIVTLNKFLKKLKYKNLIIIVFLLLFLFLTEFSPSVMRAVIFFIVHTIFNFKKIKLSPIKELIITALIVVIINPFIIYNSGFQYSFIITGALMLKSQDISGNYFLKILKISFIALIVSLPITVSINYEINLTGIFLNVIFAPLVSLIIFPMNLLTFIFPFLERVNNLALVGLEFTNKLANYCKFIIVIPKFKIILIIVYYLFILVYLYKKKLIILIGNLIIVIITIIIPKLDNNYYVYYLDVGQGDSSIIISPFKRETIMIDTGGSNQSDFHVSDNIIVFLKSLGITKINLLIISHGDADHAKETLNLLKKYSVDNIIINHNKLNELEQLIKAKGNIVEYYSSKYIFFKNYNDYLNEDENYSSIITKVTINQYNFLYMGDAPIETELKLLQDYNISKIDFLKIGHHGSNTSTSKYFIETIIPKYSIISVGKNNIYNHPNKSVLDTLAKTKIYRTDYDGTIEIKLNKNHYQIKTYPPLESKKSKIVN